MSLGTASKTKIRCTMDSTINLGLLRFRETQPRLVLQNCQFHPGKFIFCERYLFRYVYSCSMSYLSCKKFCVFVWMCVRPLFHQKVPAWLWDLHGTVLRTFWSHLRCDPIQTKVMIKVTWKQTSDWPENRNMGNGCNLAAILFITGRLDSMSTSNTQLSIERVWTFLWLPPERSRDRKSTRLNSSHL